jgi:hypothetical protein
MGADEVGGGASEQGAGLGRSLLMTVAQSSDMAFGDSRRAGQHRGA